MSALFTSGTQQCLWATRGAVAAVRLSSWDAMAHPAACTWIPRINSCTARSFASVSSARSLIAASLSSSPSSCHQAKKRLYSSTTSSSPASEHNTNHQLHYTTLRTSADIAASHFDLSHIPSSQERDQILSDFILIPNYLSITEHDMLIQAAFKKLKRALGKQIRYEDGHFDNVITRYRECSASEWGTPPTIASGSGTLAPSSTSASTSGTTVTAAATAALPLTTERSTPLEIMQSLKLEFFPHSWNWVSPHILELESGKGGIQPHVDHLEASGEVVAGLCLGSSAVMELIHEHDPERYFRVLLPKNCFYFQRGSVRYHYKHGIPIQQQDHTFRGKVIPKENRVSIMLRNALEPSRGSQTGYNLSM